MRAGGGVRCGAGVGEGNGEGEGITLGIGAGGRSEDEEFTFGVGVCGRGEGDGADDGGKGGGADDARGVITLGLDISTVFCAGVLYGAPDDAGARKVSKISPARARAGPPELTCSSAEASAPRARTSTNQPAPAPPPSFVELLSPPRASAMPARKPPPAAGLPDC